MLSCLWRLSAISFTRLSISSLTSLTFSIGLPFGSSIPQSITLFMKSIGHSALSMQPMFTDFAEFLIMSSVIILDFWLLMSIPTSDIAWIARELMWETGLVPALIA